MKGVNYVPSHILPEKMEDPERRKFLVTWNTYMY